MIAELARPQRGRVARRQLLAAGVDRDAIEWRVETGRLLPVHRGVYALAGAPEGDEADLSAAWLYGGEQSVLTHRGAAQWFGLGYFREIDLTTPVTRRSRGRLVFHRGTIPDGEWILRSGLKVTIPARTMLDLCAVVPEPRMRRVFTDAEVDGLIDLPAIRAMLAAHPGRRGSPLLRKLAGLEMEAARGRIRSPLEARFRRFIAARRYPRPESNVRVEVGSDVYEADFLWREQRVLVEIDGGSTHHNRARFESDRERDRRLSAHGWRPVRVTKQAMMQHRRLEGDLDMLLGISDPD